MSPYYFLVVQYGKRICVELTTPVITDSDSIFPGENWFLYWKTSSSLWEEKLAQMTFAEVVLPIYWGFHSETGDRFDFGIERPEADLKRLVDILLRLQKKVIVLIPAGPLPFLPNGGVPHLLAKYVAEFHNKAWITLDSQESLQKIYSFYEPKVFRGFQKFVTVLGRYFFDHQLEVNIFTVNPYFIFNGEIYSFFNDSCACYRDAFKRYLEANQDTSLALESSEKEREVHIAFQHSIAELYQQTIKEGMGSYWDGSLDTCFLGCNFHNFINRSLGQEDELNYFRDAEQILAYRMLPSSILLGTERSDLLKTCSKNYFVDIISKEFFSSELVDESSTLEFSRLKLFTLFYSATGVGRMKMLEGWRGSSSPLHLLRAQYQGCFFFESTDKISIQRIIDDQDDRSICFFSATNFGRDEFHALIKLFMHGRKVILDVHNLSSELLQRIDTFFIENSIEVQKVNFRTMIRCARLGEGMLTLYDSSDLQILDSKSIQDFWDKILSLFQFEHIVIEAPAGVTAFWMNRLPSAKELSFESIRRVTIYNVYSYRVKVKLHFSKNFLVVKTLDAVEAEVTVQSRVVEISFYSQGAVTLDFGYVGNE